jgi:hypothetical protein
LTSKITLNGAGLKGSKGLSITNSINSFEYSYGYKVLPLVSHYRMSEAQRMTTLRDGKEKAKEKQIKGGKEKVVQKSAEPSIETREEVAKIAGVSVATVCYHRDVLTLSELGLSEREDGEGSRGS